MVEPCDTSGIGASKCNGLSAFCRFFEYFTIGGEWIRRSGETRNARRGAGGLV